MITDSFKNYSLFWVPLIVCLLLAGCGPDDKPADNPDLYILKSGPLVITLREFNEELELKKSAYSYDIKDDFEAYNEMVIDLLGVLSEELRFLQLASDKGIVLTSEEFASAEAEFKKDYPENSLDQLLLENAISYPLWEKRFKRKLLIEKIIQQELTENIEISADEIYEFYQQEVAGETDENELIKKLRMKKTQIQYDQWVQHLNEIYPVDINTDLLKTLLKGLSHEKDE